MTKSIDKAQKGEVLIKGNFGDSVPSLASSNAFSSQNNAPIYVPDASVNNYKNATNWVNLASRIFPISSKS